MCGTEVLCLLQGAEDLSRIPTCDVYKIMPLVSGDPLSAFYDSLRGRGWPQDALQSA